MGGHVFTHTPWSRLLHWLANRCTMLSHSQAAKISLADQSLSEFRHQNLKVTGGLQSAGCVERLPPVAAWTSPRSSCQRSMR